MTDQRLWRTVTTMIIGGALLTLTMLLWLGRNSAITHGPAPTPSGVFTLPVIIITPHSCWKFRAVVHDMPCPPVPPPASAPSSP